jgi:peptidoglycan/xylan/chitin deacetylase (PgdA/CDA1 family)
VAVQARRWQPAPAIRVTIAMHVLGFAVLPLHPASWPWVLLALAGNHLVLIGAIFCPRSRLHGPNLVRLPAAAARRGEIALTFDDGPDPHITPRVLDLLDQYRMKASFFCVGEKVCAYPDVVAEIARRGHSVENHSYRHAPWFAMRGPWRMAREVEATQAAIERITGQRPNFFRAPNGFRPPWLDFVLAKRGLHYVSWTRRGYDTVRRNPAPVVRDLTLGLAAGDVLLLHDSGSARAHHGQCIVLAVLPVLLQHIRDRGLSSVALRTAFNDA